MMVEGAPRHIARSARLSLPRPRKPATEAADAAVLLATHDRRLVPAAHRVVRLGGTEASGDAGSDPDVADAAGRA